MARRKLKQADPETDAAFEITVTVRSLLTVTDLSASATGNATDLALVRATELCAAPEGLETTRLPPGVRSTSKSTGKVRTSTSCASLAISARSPATRHKPLIPTGKESSHAWPRGWGITKTFKICFVLLCDRRTLDHTGRHQHSVLQTSIFDPLEQLLAHEGEGGELYRSTVNTCHMSCPCLRPKQSMSSSTW